MAHDHPNILNELVKLIDDERNDIFIMLDAKANIKDFDFIKSYKSKLLWCKNRIKVYWGHASQIENELNLFKEAKTYGNYDYFHLLSGVDIPIKSQNFIHNLFDTNKGKEFIYVSKSENVPKIMSYKLDHYKIFSKYYRDPRKIPRGLTRKIRNCFCAFQNWLNIKRTYPWEKLYYGSNWVSITQDFVNYLIENENKVLKSFQYTYCVDEVYKQTLIMNSHFKKNLFPNGNLREIDWSSGEIKEFTVDDINLLKSSENIFARKIDPKSYKHISNHLIKIFNNE